MGVAHLIGKRTGRRRGSRTRPHWQRAVEWAEQHLGKPDAVPPSALAGLLVAQARERPDLFAAMLAVIHHRTAGPGLEANRKAAQAVQDKPRPVSRRLKTVALSLDFMGIIERRSVNVPADLAFVGSTCEVTQKGKASIVVAVSSATFAMVPEKCPIPEL